MPRRMIIKVTTALEVIVEDESITAEEIVNELDYKFTSTLERTTITDTRIDDYEIDLLSLL